MTSFLPCMPPLPCLARRLGPAAAIEPTARRLQTTEAHASAPASYDTCAGDEPARQRGTSTGTTIVRPARVPAARRQPAGICACAAASMGRSSISRLRRRVAGALEEAALRAGAGVGAHDALLRQLVDLLVDGADGQRRAAAADHLLPQVAIDHARRRQRRARAGSGSRPGPARYPHP